MKLTGNCKEEFEKWLPTYLDPPMGDDKLKGKRLFYVESHDYYKFINTEHYFFNLPFSMQYGVLVDFFDSVGIYINAFSPDYFEIHTGWDVVMNEGKVDRSRSEARTEAIKKANDLFNGKFK